MKYYAQCKKIKYDVRHREIFTTFDLRNLFSPQSYSTTTMQHNAGLNLRNHITFDVSTSLDSWPEI